MHSEALGGSQAGNYRKMLRSRALGIWQGRGQGVWQGATRWQQQRHHSGRLRPAQWLHGILCDNQTEGSEIMTAETLLSNRQRADCYKLLAECYYFPEDGLGSMLDCFDKLGNECFPEIIRVAPKADDLERHQVDYSSLFVGPFKLLAPPYGSIYLEDGKFMGHSTTQVQDMNQQEGLDIIVKDAPDHISVELEFMYFLALKEAAAQENSDEQQAECLRKKQASFLRIHLGMWVTEFARNVEQHAETGFYKAVGFATESFVLKDLVELSGECQL